MLVNSWGGEVYRNEALRRSFGTYRITHGEPVPKDVAVECVKVVTEATVAQPKEYPSAGKYVVSCVTKKNKNRMIGSFGFTSHSIKQKKVWRVNNLEIIYVTSVLRLFGPFA